jgi:hypothetical protein
MKHFAQPLAVTFTAKLQTANTILANPSGFYLNIHTARNPDGVVRGQLTRAQ